jgi:hypothetical protein
VLFIQDKTLVAVSCSIGADERAHRQAMELATGVTLSMERRGVLLKWEVVVNS